MNDWQRRFGASRRAKDRALLASMEREIAAAEKAAEKAADKAAKAPGPAPVISDEERTRIARAFGRPA